MTRESADVTCISEPVVLRLMFGDDHPLAGSEIKVCAPDQDELDRLESSLLRLIRAGDRNALPDADETRTLTAMIESIGGVRAVFASALIAWNLRNSHGNRVPPTTDGVNSLTDDEILLIVSAWLAAIEFQYCGHSGTFARGQLTIHAPE